MKLEKIEVTDTAVAAMVRDILKRETSRAEGQATYLRTLTAAVQVELGGAPRMTSRGRVKVAAPDAAIDAVGKAHTRFYAIVLAELDQTQDAQTRNAQSGFARSAVSTLRSAVRAGLNPLEIVIPEVTKGSLRTWTKAHTPEVAGAISTGGGPISMSEAERAAKVLVKRLAALIEPMSQEAKAEVLTVFHAELATLNAEVNYEPAAPAILAAPRLRRPNGHRLAA